MPPSCPSCSSRPLPRWTPHLLSSLVLSTLPGYATAADVQLPEVVVTERPPLAGQAESGYRVETVNLGPLGPGSLQETPLSINVVPASLIANTQAGSLTDALKYVPTVQSSTGNGRITDYYMIRGFIASPWNFNMAVDGMRAFDIYQPMEDKERVEVLNGASGFLYGVTSPAGTINFVTKRPTAEAFQALSFGTYGGSQVYGHLDAGGPLGDGERFAYRLNVLYGDKGEIGVDRQTQERSLVSGALDWKLSRDTKLSFDLSWAARDFENAQPLFVASAATGIPAAPDLSANRGSPASYSKDSTTRFGAELSSRLDDRFTLRASLRHADVDREYLLTRQVWQNSKYDYKLRVDYQKGYHTVSDQGGLFLDTLLHTGPLTHQITLGTTVDQVDFRFPIGGTGTATSTTVYPGNILGGVTASPGFTLPAASATNAQRTTYQTWMAADRLRFGEAWSALIGANYAQVDDATWNPATGTRNSQYKQDKVTPALSLMYQPLPNLNTYLSYVEALQQGFVAPATATNAGQAFAPYVGKQTELGMKASLGQVDLTAALFRIEQPNQYVDNNVYTQDGRETHKGLELGLSGRVTSRFTLYGGLTALSAKVDRTATASLLGKTPQGVADRTARLYGEYDLPDVQGLTLTGGVSYTARAYVDAANLLTIPSVTLFDAGARYRQKIFGQDLTLRLNVNNLLDRNYWTTRSSMLYPGSPRTIAVSGTIRF